MIAPASRAAAALLALAATASGLAVEQSSPRTSKAPKTPKALVGITHWQPGLYGGKLRRNAVLLKTLEAFGNFTDVELRFILTTNEYVNKVKHIVPDQVVRPDPVCSKSWEHKFCMAWETIRAMRTAAFGGDPRTELDAKLKGNLKYDYYIYTESDIKIPPPTFNFWREHAPDLFSRGYLLLTLRLEDHLLSDSVIAVDCYKPECVKKTEVLRDEAGLVSLYKNEEDKMYLRPYNPYSGSFMMTRKQFKTYLEGPMWDYHTVWVKKLSPWAVRETAASGLLWDPRYGNQTGVTHLKMAVWHQIPMNGVGKGVEASRIAPSRFHKVSEYADKVSECAGAGASKCQTL